MGGGYLTQPFYHMAPRQTMPYSTSDFGLNGGETYRSALMRAWKNAKIGLDASEQKTSVEDMLDR
jgi:hypothetical protein